ncbi:MAG TPA: GNAT family N-acetyltransferase [Candidatus Paceibacterota bacterium]|nr:GNAT family N-acetyltransferase [Verrucomicrobiota bacterium]HOX02057.1 GNAT family N-acetyltransferase [Verrucomicrobiota bacterium]HRZ45319.1 GNAT family N-acetyltransferase [Candidatus Paceibacterota bacterium]HRZ91538.1 GNAT family N-acetyltransferase [Candidatus Paceibacterota bacterium]
MNTPLRVRALTRADLAFADRVRELAGWNQTRADWERFLATEPDGCFLAEWNGQPAGTATTTVYGSALAWIGMVLVHPDARRRGIGSALLRHCMDCLRKRGVRSVKLDATPLGRPLYQSLGFEDEWPLARWAGASPPPTPSRSDPRLRPWDPKDTPSVQRLDEAAFGISRQRILHLMLPQTQAAWIFESEPGRISGYGMLRAGSRAFYLGPVAAESAEAGIGLAERLLAGCPGQPVYWDIPEANEPAIAWAGRIGLAVQRPLMRMFAGVNLAPGDPRRQFALAGPEIG